MTTTATKTNREQLPETAEKKMVAAINTEFASDSETFRASAVIWGRKQLKYEKGLRSSKPPIPAGLQHATNRAKTQATLEKIATAIGADINYTPAGTKTAAVAAEPVAAKPEVTPDPKTSRRSSAKKVDAAAA